MPVQPQQVAYNTQALQPVAPSRTNAGNVGVTIPEHAHSSAMTDTSQLPDSCIVWVYSFWGLMCITEKQLGGLTLSSWQQIGRKFKVFCCIICLAQTETLLLPLLLTLSAAVSCFEHPAVTATTVTHVCFVLIFPTLA